LRQWERPAIPGLLRTWTHLDILFAAAALLLAIAGIYGVNTYIPLAARGEAVHMKVLKGRAGALAGIAAGLAAAVGLTRLMAGLRYGAEANDPTSLALVALILAATASRPPGWTWGSLCGTNKPVGPGWHSACSCSLRRGVL
jgi:hypothetical protein